MRGRGQIVTNTGFLIIVLIQKAGRVDLIINILQLITHLPARNALPMAPFFQLDAHQLTPMRYNSEISCFGEDNRYPRLQIKKKRKSHIDDQKIAAE